MLNKLKTVAAGMVSLAALMATNMSAHAERKYPNWFAYAQASRENWDARYGDKLPAERGRPYFVCNYTTRTCLNGTSNYSAGHTHFIGVVVDGTDRKTVLAHIACNLSLGRCENFDEGIDYYGKRVTLPDLPLSCVEEMRKSGAECDGYSSSLGVLDQGNAARQRLRDAPEIYIKTPNGFVTPKHKCTTTPCVDCTFLTYEACYARAKQAGLTDETPIGFGPGKRVPLRINPQTGAPLPEKPLERECDRSWNNNTTSIGNMGAAKGQIICPVPGAVIVEAPVSRSR
jgi:hypothetical protein